MLVLALTVTAGCTRNGGPMEIFTPPPPPEVAYVSPDGGDLADGTENAPFATLRRALQTDRPRIVMLPGVFPEPEVNVSRSVRIEGTVDGRAVLEGHLFISAPDVVVRRLDVTDGIATHLAAGLIVASATISAGKKDDALSLVSTRIRLEDLLLRCGPETCLQATTATVVGARIRARAVDASKRIVRVETSSATLEGLTLIGGSITQLQAERDSHVTVRSSTLSDGQGNGLAAVSKAVLEVRDTHVSGARRLSLLVNRARARVRSSRLRGTADLTAGVAGGHLVVQSSTLSASPNGTLSISANFGEPGHVELRGGVLEHLDQDGVLVSQGTLVVEGTRFEGDGRPGGDTGDAILASSPEARVEVRSAHFVRPRNFAVVFNADATGTVTATVTEPGAGGVLVDDVAIEPVVLRDLVVEGCRTGSGVVALRAPRIDVEGGRVRGCAEAGYLAGTQSNLHIRGARAIDNTEYGFAAFGGSAVHLESSRASGGRWAAFASCGDGSRIDVGDDVELEGQVATCP